MAAEAFERRRPSAAPETSIHTSRPATIRLRGRCHIPSSSTAVTIATAHSRPVQAAATVPIRSLPVSPHTRPSTTLPPSSGRPGTRLNKPTRRLAVEVSDSTDQPMRATMAPSTCAASPSPGSSANPTAAISRFTIGPTTDTTVDAHQRGFVRPKAVCPPAIESTIRSTGQPKARAAPAWASSCSSTETPSRRQKPRATA